MPQSSVGDDAHPVPNFELDASLPITAHAKEITALLHTHQVLIVAGETGSGKTTQLPKIALALGGKSIAHTQPRRIAARSVAVRIAAELGVPLGDVVGYQVRFNKQAGSNTRLKLVTDGVLLAEIAGDRNLRRYDTIIIDEAHERSLNIDFLLGYLKQLLPRRPDLKVIITSATIDTERFAAHFDGAQVVEVSGRSYPVEVLYRPLAVGMEQTAAILEAVKELRIYGDELGDILVFCAGEREIREAAETLIKAKLPGIEVLPLFARLSADEQQRVFASHPGQRIVLATNVAETSLTVPGIRYVVDPGFARISRYSVRTKVQRLPIEAISRASADQRKGRCGRLAPGICIRLYSEDDYNSRPAFTEPEILRTNLAAVILRMVEAKLGDIRAFPFVAAPDERQIADGLRLLDELGALAVKSRTHAQLTQTGHNLARLPVDPRLGRILLTAADRGCLSEALVLVSGLSLQDVRERPTEKRALAAAAHARFATDDILNVALRETIDLDISNANMQNTVGGGKATGRHHHTATNAASGEVLGAAISEHTSLPLRHTVHTGTHIDRSIPAPDSGGDVAALLRLWKYLNVKRSQLSSSAFRRLCKAEYLNYSRVREWHDLNWQLGEVCRDLGLKMNNRPADMDTIITAMLSGLLGHIGLLERDERDFGVRGSKRLRGSQEYLGTRGSRFAISPASLLAQHPPSLVMATELVETTRLWAHSVAEVSAEQVLAVGGHLLRHTYFEPHFSPTTGTVAAFRSTTLLGVPIISGVSVDYGSVNQAKARAIFIQGALLEQAWMPRPGTDSIRLFEHNAFVRKQALEIAARERTPEISELELTDWFATRLPSGIATGAQLEEWLRAAKHNFDALCLQIADLTAQPDEQAYPGVWSFGGAEAAIDYHFEPKSERDGATVRIPMAKLAEANPASFTWGLPGQRQELATALIRSLPKRLRTSFVPAPDFATKALNWLLVGQADESLPFTDELARALRELTGVELAPSDWNYDAVPAHLKLNFAVTHGEREVAFGKDLAAMQRDYGKQITAALTQAGPTTKRGTTWVFGTIPEQISVTKDGVTAHGYPGLRDEGQLVGEAVFDTAKFAASQHARALVRLLSINLPDPTKWVLAHLSKTELLVLSTSPYPNVTEVLHDARYKAITQLMNALGCPAQVRDEAAYDTLARWVQQAQTDQIKRVVSVGVNVLQGVQEVQKRLDTLSRAHPAFGDVTAQLADLVYCGFISKIRDPWYDALPRYLKAVSLRLETIATNPAVDAPRMAMVERMQDAYVELLNAVPQGHPVPDEVADIAWLIEEYRVQVFAQRLGTAVPVSEKRLLKAISHPAQFAVSNANLRRNRLRSLA
ncbi:MAG: ATP-dependent RNA helicase HrpA [Propionibacteriaceae bacterium]|jgi:ATP-dependent helicase HrpA|nr:ATP-dependent RNA helicase HrpA [Propionibacteriaceae bacterium]